MRRMTLLALAAIATVLAIGGADAFAADSTPSCNKPPKIPDNFATEIDNPYFPLEPGTTYRYTGHDGGDPAEDVVEVTDQTKEIVGVTTTVVRDRVYLAGELAEDTLDWYAQDAKGNVWYFGEDTKEYENGQVVSTEGSWEAGKHQARAGIFMPAKPKEGQVLQQELAPRVAEDCFKVVDLHASVESPYVSSDDALKTKEFTRLEPGVFDHKWYVAGTGVVRDKGPDDEYRLVSVQHG